MLIGVGAGCLANASGYIVSNVAGIYGSITINSNGSYQYVVDNSNATVQALRLSSQTLSDLFTYEVVDAGGLTSLAKISITLRGANDALVSNTDTATAVLATKLALPRVNA